MMQLVYLDRVVNMRTRDISKNYPTLVGWNDEVIRIREKFEMKKGNFGIGNIEERMAVPADVEVEKQEGEAEDVQEVVRSVHTQAGRNEVYTFIIFYSMFIILDLMFIKLDIMFIIFSGICIRFCYYVQQI